MIRFYIVGVFVLVGAIFANLFAAKIQCKTWYDFLQGLYENKAFWNEISIKDILWLFLFYPIFLGVSAILGNNIYEEVF